MTDQVILDHLQGRHVIGVYPLLRDDTCGLLAIDFDKNSWKEDVSAFRQTCARLDVPVLVERSRPGNGAHVWMFFAAPVPASDARKLGSYLLTLTMSEHHTLDMRSYDRMFPNQDTMPRGGFGNLVALPLQLHAREKGNTVFVNEHFEPLADQWQALAGHPLLAPDRVQQLARQAKQTGTVLDLPEPKIEDEAQPWERPPSGRRRPRIVGTIPKEVRAVLRQLAFIETVGLPRARSPEGRRAWWSRGESTPLAGVQLGWTEARRRDDPRRVRR